jgi:uncharacterized protein
MSGADCVKGVGRGAGGERLIVFVRLPVPGRVKTRLSGPAGPEKAAALYRCFVADTLATVARTGVLPLLFFDPVDAGEAVRAWLGEDMTYLPQVGEDLGGRMAAAFRKAFRSCSRAVLIGSDCPDLPESLVSAAFEGLKTHDAVIGPAGDGGYYLIGFSRSGFTEAAFDGIEWGTESVFRDTAAILEKGRVSLHVLPVWSDVDDLADLEALLDRNRDTPYGRLTTVDFLREHPCVK